MRRTEINLNISRHHRAKGESYGCKIEVGCRGLPMSLLYAIRNYPLQWRAVWSGPTSDELPTLHTLWGWEPADGWTPGYAYVRHERIGASRIKWTLSRSAIRLHTGQDVIPLGKWSGTMTCDPDEETPLRISIVVSPRVYVPRAAPVRRVAVTPPTFSSPLPRVDLP